MGFSFPSWHRSCFRESMMDFALSILALLAGGFALELYSAAWASTGYQGDHGSHLGAEPHPSATDFRSEKLR
jgi:hypothetical protein